MIHTKHDLVFGTNSIWTQMASYSSDPSDSWRCLSVSARLCWPDDLLVNGYHDGIEMDWFVECYDNTISTKEEESQGALGQISFRKDITGYPRGIIVLSLQDHGFPELWDRATSQLLGKTTVDLSVLGILPSDEENRTQWLTSKADRLTVRSLRLTFNQGASAEGNTH